MSIEAIDQINYVSGTYPKLVPLLKKLGIDTGTLRPDLPIQNFLETLDAQTLMKLHNETCVEPHINYIGNNYGSINAYRGVIKNNNTLRSQIKPYHNLTANQSQGVHFYGLDFIPFGRISKDPKQVSEALFIGSHDMLNFINDQKNADPMPSIIYGGTNAEMARLACNKLGFNLDYISPENFGLKSLSLDAFNHIFGLKHNPLKIINDEKAIQIMNDLAAGKIRYNKNNQYTFFIYIPSNELFDLKMVTKLQKTQKTLYKHIAGRQSAKEVTDQDLESLVRRIRIKAILKSQEDSRILHKD